MSWRWNYLDTLLDPYHSRSRSWNYSMYDKYYGDLLGSKSDYFSTYYTDLSKSYPSTYYPSTYYPSSYYYPYSSDTELRYPYRIRSPLSVTGYPTYRVAPRSWLPNWYPSYTNWPRALRDPWWYDLPIYRGPTKSTYPLIRQSYLSPVKRTYVWSQHPIRRGVRYGNLW